MSRQQFYQHNNKKTLESFLWWMWNHYRSDRKLHTIWLASVICQSASQPASKQASKKKTKQQPNEFLIGCVACTDGGFVIGCTFDSFFTQISLANCAVDITRSIRIEHRANVDLLINMHARSVTNDASYLNWLQSYDAI